MLKVKPLETGNYSITNGLRWHHYVRNRLILLPKFL